MRNFILIVFLFIVMAFGFRDYQFTYGNEIVFNGPVTAKSTRDLWRSIYVLDAVLKKDKEIVIYFDSLGGALTPTEFLLERIKYIQKKGRVLRGVIYGQCASACGTIWASMNSREMVKNTQYMQHLCSTGIPGFKSRACTLVDRNRLQHDAKMFRMNSFQLMRVLERGPIYYNHSEMLKFKAIERITPIEELHGI